MVTIIISSRSSSSIIITLEMKVGSAQFTVAIKACLPVF